MPKADNLKHIVIDAMAEFYQEYIKSDMTKAIEETMEVKLEEKLAPIKASIITLEKNVSVALGDYHGQQMQVSDHEKRITTLESQI